MIRSPRLMTALTALAAIVVATIPTSTVWAAPFAPLLDASDDASYRNITNDYIGVSMGVAGQIAVVYDSNGNPLMEDVPGRICFGTTGGSTLVSSDDNQMLTYPYPYPTGPYDIVTIRIVDGTNTTDAIWGDQTDGAWVQQPYTDTTNRVLTGVWEHSGSGIRVQMLVRLMGPFAKLTWRVWNTSTTSKQVGIRMLQMPHLTAMSNTFVYMAGSKQVIADTTYTGTRIGPYMSAIESRQSISPDFRWFFDTSFTGYKKPDRVILGHYDRVDDGLWIPGIEPEDADPRRPAFMVCPVVFWDPVAVGPAVGTNPPPGLVVSSVVGLGTSTLTTGDTFAVDTEAITSLSLDSTVPGGITPTNFAVNAGVHNLTDLINPMQMRNVSVSISLPKGLALASGETSSKTIATLGPGASSTVGWRVVPTGERTGSLEYIIKAGVDLQTLTVKRSVFVPASPVVSMQRDYDMVCFPYAFRDDTPETVLGLPSAAFSLLRWNTISFGYEKPAAIKPGEGYWFKGTTDRTINLTGAVSSGDPFTQTYTMDLPSGTGWVQIGNPYPFGIAVGQLAVLDRRQARRLSLEDAISRGLLRSVIFEYDRVEQSYKATSLLSDPAKLLQPGKAYWIYVDGRDLQLEYPASTLTGATYNYPSRRADSGWMARLRVRAAGQMDGSCLIGSGAASEQTVPAVPEAPQQQIRATLSRAGTPAALSADIRAGSSGRREWTLNIQAPAGAETVAISVETLQSMPQGLRLRLIDKEGNKTVDLNRVSECRVAMNGSTSRQVTLVAEPIGNGALRIGNVRVTRTRGQAVSVTYTLSSAATVKVRVLSSSGKLVTDLAATSEAGRGVNTVTWNGRNAEGTAMPAGAYMVDITAANEDGQVARAVQPVVLTR